MDEPPFLTTGELLEGYAARRFSPVEVIEAVAARIELVEPALRAFVALDLDRAAAEAGRAAAAWTAGAARPLEGVPLAAKDLFDTREEIRADFLALFEAVDVLITPVYPGAPPEGGCEEVEHLGVATPFRDLVLPFTTPQNLVGLPVCTARAGFDELGIPVGVQLTAAPGREGAAITAAQALYAATGELQRRRPAL